MCQVLKTIKEINSNLNKSSTIVYRSELKKNSYKVKLNSTIKNKINTYSTFILST